MDTQERVKRLKEIFNEGRYGWEDAIYGLAEEIPEGEFEPKYIDDIELDHGRWMFYMMTIVELNENEFYGMNWEKGKTESQENMWDDDRIFPVEKIVIETYEWKPKK